MVCYPQILTAREIYFQKFVHEKVFLRGKLTFLGTSQLSVFYEAYAAPKLS